MGGPLLKKSLVASLSIPLAALRSVDKNVGGQAVIEGVMIRSPEKVSTSLRLSDGSIHTKTEPFVSITKKKKILNKPIIRGVISFVEMLVLGIKTLNYSAEIAARDSENKEPVIADRQSGKLDLAVALTVIFSISMGLAIFFFLPILITQLLAIPRDAVGFNLVAGAVRMLIFLFYIWSLSRFESFRRIFQYHGAEHKSIFAFESDLPLKVESTRGFTTHHPRCGTSFILIVALLAILTYSVSDTVFAVVIGHPPGLFERFSTHLLFLPMVAGLSFELLKLSGKTRSHPVTRFLIAPGLWIQRITTREPSDDQVEVALTALKESIAGTYLDPEPA
ncbi:MAG: DUF1385 domain-containing protein [Candidatus Zixiibacteriota bacterium]|nr:MAG: DUF1385 domain-containing protein [candidate division Zixibacteria bacterium]